MRFKDRLRAAPRNGGFAMDDWWVWCGSAIEGEDGRFHLFASRWPRELPFFSGYVTRSEVVRAVARDPAGPYELEEVVLPARGPEYWDGRMTHNPVVIRAAGAYLLFYIGSTYSGASPTAAELRKRGDSHPVCEECYANIRIGCAAAPSPNGPWMRRDAPILLPRPGHWDDTIVTNPAPCIRPDGSLFLLYRSNTPKGMRIGAAESASWTGPYRRITENPVLDLPGGEVEDPFIWRDNGSYALLAKDMDGAIGGEPGAGVMARSPDGVHWTLCDPPQAYSRLVTWDDGSCGMQGTLERPQLLFRNGVPTHLFAATGDGGFSDCTRTWTMVIPLNALPPEDTCALR